MPVSTSPSAGETYGTSCQTAGKAATQNVVPALPVRRRLLLRRQVCHELCVGGRGVCSRGLRGMVAADGDARQHLLGSRFCLPCEQVQHSPPIAGYGGIEDVSLERR